MKYILKRPKRSKEEVHFSESDHWKHWWEIVESKGWRRADEGWKRREISDFEMERIRLQFFERLPDCSYIQLEENFLWRKMLGQGEY